MSLSLCSYMVNSEEKTKRGKVTSPFLGFQALYKVTISTFPVHVTWKSFRPVVAIRSKSNAIHLHTTSFPPKAPI